MKALNIGNKIYFEGKYKSIPNLLSISINIQIEASNFNLVNLTNYMRSNIFQWDQVSIL